MVLKHTPATCAVSWMIAWRFNELYLIARASVSCAMHVPSLEARKPFPLVGRALAPVQTFRVFLETQTASIEIGAYK